MKKNRMMRLACLLLVLTMVTTCGVCGTFAKYVTQDDASDIARVAKWGVELQVVGNLYGDTYKDAIVAEDDSTLTVQAADHASHTTDIVAPGTENDSGFIFSLQGQPEVAGEITSEMKIQNIFLKQNTYGMMIPVDDGVVTEANFLEFGNQLYYKDGDAFKLATAWADTDYYTLEDEVTVSDDYYPVVYTLAGNTATTGTNDQADSLKAAADLIAAQLGLTAATPDTDTSITYTGTKAFVPNTDLADELKVDGLTLTWAWAFELGDTDEVKAENNGADTILGLLENVTEGTIVKLDTDSYVAVVEYEDYCLDTQFNLNITVEQVD